jgi:hypothetical protein
LKYLWSVQHPHFVITLPGPQNDGDILQVVEFVTTNLRGGLPWKGMSDELKGPQKVGPSWMTDSHLLVVFGMDTYHFHSEIGRPLLAYRAFGVATYSAQLPLHVFSADEIARWPHDVGSCVPGLHVVPGPGWLVLVHGPFTFTLSHAFPFLDATLFLSRWSIVLFSSNAILHYW